MEDTTITNGATTGTPEPVAQTPPATPPTSMQDGGMSDSGQKLGWVAIMMLGLASASLIYSIFYYKRRLEALKNGDNKMIAQLQADMDEMKSKIDSLTGKRVMNARLV
jgi:hypothetical protein